MGIKAYLATNRIESDVISKRLLLPGAFNNTPFQPCYTAAGVPESLA